jgi:hypothetical protein
MKGSNDSNLLRGNERGRDRLPALVYRANEREARKFGCTGNTAGGGYLGRLFSSSGKKTAGRQMKSSLTKEDTGAAT